MMTSSNDCDVTRRWTNFDVPSQNYAWPASFDAGSDSATTLKGGEVVRSIVKAQLGTAHLGEIRHFAHLFGYFREITRHLAHVRSLNIEPIFNIEAMNPPPRPNPSAQPQFRRASIQKHLPSSASLRARVSCRWHYYILSHNNHQQH